MERDVLLHASFRNNNNNPDNSSVFVFQLPLYGKCIQSEV